MLYLQSHNRKFGEHRHNEKCFNSMTIIKYNKNVKGHQYKNKTDR